ncbi:MAG: hypothetical protein HY321_17440 [Armatimonadetes bacterium]|nr:hypothetical protein [Armatimonadota bacterium]
METKRGPAWRTGDALRHVLMPLGGLGAGSIGLSGTGELREWAIFNRPGHLSLVKNTYFALWAKAEGSEPIYRVLQKHTTDCPYIRMGNLHLHEVEDVRFCGQYPVAALEYLDGELPVRASMQCSSPCIPLNVEDSSLPAVLFHVRLRNPGSHAVDVSLLASLLNAVGYDGQGEIYWNILDGARGNVIHFVRRPAYAALNATSTQLPPDAPYYGTLALAVLHPEVTYRTRCLFPPDSYLARFMETGRLANEEDETPCGSGVTPSGMIAAHLRLEPGEEKSVRALIAWHFPNRVAYWQSSRARIGNRYAVRFSDALDVAEYVAENLEPLSRGTEAFRSALFGSTLPVSVLDAASSQIVIPRSSTCFWTEEGVFAGFEGSRSAEGSCPLSCTHVWNYEQTLAHLFPELARNMRETDLGVQTGDDGLVRHRLILPLSAPRGYGPALDGQLGTILKTYREYLLQGDRRFLRRHWATLQRVMGYVFERWDPERLGIIDDVPQPNTYDLALRGINSFTGTLYLAALRAMEQMARRLGHEAEAARYRETFLRGAEELDRRTFNGEFYVQRCTPSGGDRLQYGPGCLADQLIGQWWANILGLGHLLPAGHVRSALESVYRHNFRCMEGFRHTQRVFAEGSEWGVVNCAWPNGGRPEEPMHYCHEVWTGVEYAFAALLIQEGLVAEGLKVVAAVRQRHDGTRRNPWNDCEAGSYYVRSMSSWSLITALQGFTCDMGAAEVRFSPRASREDFRSFFSTATAWGTFSQRLTGGEWVYAIEVARGSLSIRTLYLDLPPEAGSLQARLGGARVAVEPPSGESAVRFRETCIVEAGAPLQVTARRTSDRENRRHNGEDH